MKGESQSPSGLKRFIQSFSDVLKLPRAFWIVVGAFVVESMAYFGILTLMVTYLSGDLGWTDAQATNTVSVFTGLVTLFMLGAGSYAESFGLRRAILFALAISASGRVIYCLAQGAPSGTLAAMMILGSLLIVAIGSAILQPVCYSGVKQCTDAKTSSMDYGLQTFCPKDAAPDALRTESMWLIYACIAMFSPIGLWLGRKWVMQGLEKKPALKAG